MCATWTGAVAGRNGKVAGVVTGVRWARHERVVLADDDVRYDDASLRAVVAGSGRGGAGAPPERVHQLAVARPLGHRPEPAEPRGLPRPPRHLRRTPFLLRRHGRLRRRRAVREPRADADRGVLRRPGRRPARRLRRPHPPGRRPLLVPASAPGVRRPRAAHTAAAGAVCAATGPAGPSSRAGSVLAGALAAVLVAEAGRRRAGGASAYPRSAAWWALPWLGERSVCVWLALAQVPRGGAPYAGGRVRRAATPIRRLRSRTRRPLEGNGDRSGGDGVGLIPAVRILETTA